jgi:DNA-binding Xre family transcriptional regulator
MSTICFTELQEKLAEQHDVDALCELLKITPEDLVEAFADRIEANYSHLILEIE